MSFALRAPAPTRARRPARRRLALEPLDVRALPAAATAYLATDLVSDQAGVAPITDSHLVNAWGIAVNSMGGAFWVSSNGQDLSTIYTGDTKSTTPLAKATLEVTIP